MLNHKNYIDIPRLKETYTSAFHTGDIIQITEKLDGSNASVQYDVENNSICAYSRKQSLDFKNNLSGFYEFTQNMDVEFLKKYSDYRFFGEWNLKHLVKYPEDRIKNFYCFDIYDTKNGKWMEQDFVKRVCKEGNISLVPEFYFGEFISWEHIMEFVGKTSFGLEHGEGVVVKNQSNLNNPNSKTPFVVKIVGEKYQEVSKHRERKPVSPEELAKREYQMKLTESIVTKNRVEKILYKMVMDGELRQDWDEQDMKSIARIIPSKVYEDCQKEESETVSQIENFGKTCSSVTMKYCREILNNR